MKVKAAKALASNLLRTQAGLREKVEELLALLQEQGAGLPLFHFTSGAIRTKDNRIVPLPWVDDIVNRGFRPCDTNFGGFVARGETPRVHSPAEVNSEDFVAEVFLVNERYRHHGERTNKASLGSMRDSGTGLPVLVIVVNKGLELRHGSDFDNHWVCESGTSPESIAGVVDAQGRTDRLVLSVVELLLARCRAQGGSMQ